MTDTTFNMRSLSNATYICESIFSGRRYLNKTQINLLIAINIILMVVNLVANSSVVYALASTKQLHNVSIRLVLFLSISDCCLALIAQPLFVVMLTRYSNSSNCMFETVVEFLIVFSVHIPGFLIVLIACDRYVRMKYVKRYSLLIESWKVHTCIAMVIFLSFIEGIVYAIGTQLNVFAQVNTLVLIADTLMILSIMAAYVLTIRVVKKQRSQLANRRVLDNVDQIISGLATKIIIAVTMFYVPYVGFAMTRPSLIDQTTGEKREWLSFVMFITYELIFANSIANAVIFLNLNKKSRNRLFDIGITRLSVILDSVRPRSFNKSEENGFDT